MPYAPPSLVLDAVAALDGANPLSVVTLPALLWKGAQLGLDPAAVAVPFRSSDESALLTRAFEVPRPPDPDRPFRAPWSTREPWQTRRYSSGGLQRMRTDASGRGHILLQTKANVANQPDDWRLTPTAGAELVAKGAQQVKLIDLALWIGRNIDTATIDPAILAPLPHGADDIDKLLAWFKHEYQVDVGDLVGTIYVDGIPAPYRTVSFEPNAIGDATYEQLGAIPPAPTVSVDLATLVGALEIRMTAAGYQLPPGMVRRVLTAWLRGDMVVLVGQPGTGKTLFASLLGRAMEAELDLDAPLIVSIRADYDEAEFIGYERLDGTPQLREFATSVLDEATPLEARVVILEEFNLAPIETYLASILVAAQERERVVRLPAGEQRQLPVDTFIIATCNSYRDEPETRTRVSTPTKRRATVITMPNVLGDQYELDEGKAILDLTMNLIVAEQDRVQARSTSGRSAQFDSLRDEALRTVNAIGDLSQGVQDALVDVAAAILGTPAGRSWFTLGLLRDVALAIAHSERDEASELAALGDAVADKLVHQLRGTHADATDLLAACANLPNAAEIERLVDRMKDGPSDELLSLV